MNNFTFKTQLNEDTTLVQVQIEIRDLFTPNVSGHMSYVISYDSLGVTKVGEIHYRDDKWDYFDRNWKTWQFIVDEIKAAGVDIDIPANVDDFALAKREVVVEGEDNTPTP